MGAYKDLLRRESDAEGLAEHEENLFRMGVISRRDEEVESGDPPGGRKGAAGGGRAKDEPEEDTSPDDAGASVSGEPMASRAPTPEEQAELAKIVLKAHEEGF